jgi:hypothetical protein
MIITNAQIADFCEEGATVSVSCESVHHKETFHVQTVCGEYRPSLACFITTDTSSGDIDKEDYPEFDLGAVVSEAELFLQSTIDEEWMDCRINGESVYFITKNNGVTISTENERFINSDSSPYQTKYNYIMHFPNRSDALKYLESHADK